MLARLCLGFLLIAAALWLGYDSQFPRDEYDFTVDAARFTEHQQGDPQLNRVQIDLSGSYFGLLDYPGAGLSGFAKLEITGNTFALSIESTTLTGRITTLAAGDRIAVTMSFDPLPNGPSLPTISLSASKNATSLSLSSAPGESEKFYFRTGGGMRHKARKHARRGLASIDSNSNSNDNSGSNWSISNLSGNRNRGFPRDGNTSIVNANRIRPRPRGTPAPVRPNIDARARGAENANATSMADSNGNSNTNSNTSLSSQIRGNANVAFTTPESMKFEETKDIELLVSPSKSAEELLHNLSEPGKGETGETEYADRMEAQLVGGGFTITAASPEIQPVEPGRTTRWKWQIKPKEGGSQRLDLTLNAVLSNGKDRATLRTFHREILINVSWKQRASNFIDSLKTLQWLWAAIIVPIAGAIYTFWRKMRSK
jgi:hypothetical protein